MKSYNYTIFIVTALVLSSFSGNVKTFTNAAKWIPNDFDTRNTVLLVANFEIKEDPNGYVKKQQEKVTGEMKQIMQDEYIYKYEFVSAKELRENKKYEDKEIYRWVLADINGSNYSIHQNMSYPTNVFYFYDRKNAKAYPDTGHPMGYVSDTFKPTVATIVEYLKGLKSAPANDNAH